MSGRSTAGRVPLAGDAEGMGCTVLKHPEGGSAYQDTTEQINTEGTINLVPTLAPWQISVKDHHVMNDVLICDL